MTKRRRYKNSGYSEGGASLTKNVLKSFLPTHYSAKTDIDINLPILRNRAYDLATNSPVGAAAIQTQSTGVIGAGLKLFPRIKHKELGMTAEAAREWARKTKLEFELWANSIRCDFSRRNNFNELQNIAFVSYLTDGDSFCLFRRREPTAEYPYSLRLQIIESQRVSNPQFSKYKNVGFYNGSAVEMTGVKKGSRIVNGIEVDKSGAIEAIWVSNKIYNDPLSYDGELEWRRVKVFGEESGCRNVLHICKDSRADQYRGVPYLSPVIETLKQISRYSDSELTQSIIKSYFSIFFIQPLSNLELDQVIGKDIGEPCLEPEGFKLGSGTVTALPKGVDVKAIDASNAHSSFEVFLSSYLKIIGAALNLPYEVLLKNFQASYSASKAALLQAEDEFRQRKAAFVADFCQPVYEQFLDEAVATGRIKAAGYFDDPLRRELWRSANWYNENSHLLDPTKEVEAAQMRIALGISSHELEALEISGVDFWDNIETLALESEMKSKLLPEQGKNLTVEQKRDQDSRQPD